MRDFHAVDTALKNCGVLCLPESRHTTALPLMPSAPASTRHTPTFLPVSASGISQRCHFHLSRKALRHRTRRRRQDARWHERITALVPFCVVLESAMQTERRSAPGGYRGTAAPTCQDLGSRSLRWAKASYSECLISTKLLKQYALSILCCQHVNCLF